MRLPLPTAPAALFSLVSLAALGAHAQSDELFVFDLAESGNPSNTLTVGGSTLPDLAQDLADTEGAFASFDGVAFDAMLQYAGVAGALDISYDPTGGMGGGALLTINNIEGYDGPPIVLDEADGDLGDQLEDFFLKDNPDIIKDFLGAIAEQSVVAVTDGNPLASTARSAKYRFDRFGLFADVSPASNQINRIGVATRGRLILIARIRQIPAKGNDGTDTLVPVAARDLIDLFLGMTDTGQMGGGRNTGGCGLLFDHT